MKKRGEIKKAPGRPSGSKNKKPKPPLNVNESAVMTLRQVAEYLDCSYSNAYKLARQGKIPCFRLGDDGGWRFLKSELDNWIAKQELRPRPATGQKGKRR